MQAKRAVLGVIALVVLVAAVVLFLRKRAPRPVLIDGVLPIDMTWEQAEIYLQRNEYPVWHTQGDCAPKCTSYRIGGATLKGTKPVEEELIFEFEREGDQSPPMCVTFYPGVHGGGWEAGFDRVLGARPAIPPLDAKSAACRPKNSDELSCRLEATSRTGRVVPVELEVRPISRRVVWGLRFGACAR